MPTTFGLEILNRKVEDIAGDTLGFVADFRIDLDSGNILALLVRIEGDLDAGLLPWPTVEGLLTVPVEEVMSVGIKIKLAR
jgi:sporulation protein YlmC with PRC-barrel domain|tara:strand:+ start:1090 stop:1332 length:243 start_codon:yes stop_codon:yes gene_type:complete